MTELLQIATSKAMRQDSFPFQASFPANIHAALKPFDVNGSGTVPLELLRTYIQREDAELTNTQISSVFWCLCRWVHDTLDTCI